MARGLFDAVVLFLLPFGLYGLVLALRPWLPTGATGWTQTRVARLGLLGLALVLASLVMFGWRAPRREGAYVPAHLDGGRLVPGQIE